MTSRPWRSVAALVLVSTIGLAACSTSQPSDPEQPRELSVLTSANSGRPGLELVGPMFQDDSGIRVEMSFGETGSTAYTSQIMTQLQSGSAPDVFAAFAGTGTTSPNVGALSEANAIAPLEDTEWASRIPDVLSDSVNVDGVPYAAILGVQYSGIIYNTALFDNYGLEVPSTFAELESLVGEIRRVAPDKTPIALGAGHQAIASIVASMMAVNQPSFSPTEPPSFAESKTWRGALEDLLALRDVGAFSESVSSDDGNSILTMMTSGQAFMVIDVTSRYAAIKRLDASFPAAIAPFPGQAPGQSRMLLFPGTLFVVNGGSTRQEEAREWIDYITDPEVYRQWTEAAGGSELTPAQLAGDEAWPPQYEPLKGVTDTVMMPAVNWPNVGPGNSLGSDLPGLLQGLLSIDDVLTRMDAALSTSE